MRAPSIVSALLSGVPPSNKIIPDVPLAATERPVFAEADTHDKEASAPDMSIVSPSGLSHLAEDCVPSIAQAAAHLLLMEATWAWKQKSISGETTRKLLALLSTNRVGLQPDNEKIHSQLLAGLMEVAAPRFYSWWHAVNQKLSRMMPEEDYLELPADLLPPIDVMIIWHAYMLQPVIYEDDCSRLDVPHMRRVLFPWQAVVNAIDIRTTEYYIPSAARDFFENSSGQSADLLEELCNETHPLVYDINCPYCHTTRNLPIIPTAQTEDINHGFELECDCGYAPSVDALRSDLLHLRQTRESRLRGTYSNPALAQALYPLSRALPLPILESCTTRECFLHAIHTASYESNTPKWAVETLLSLYTPTSPVTQASSAHYSSVLRGMRFVDEMHKQCWLRSPALCVRSPTNPSRLAGTLPRAQQKYRNFLNSARPSNNLFVTPTSDMNLFWHTHQLSPEPYRRFCIRHVGKSMDYSDKVIHKNLSSSFKATQKAYSERFRGVYDACLCWSCETERNGQEVTVSNDEVSASSSKTQYYQEWARRVVVMFWQEVEARREKGLPGLKRESLEEVLAKGPRRRSSLVSLSSLKAWKY
ncbi:glycine-rich domain-containing protein 1 [Aspergillus tubingensis]|uniref:Uncharacterized protein n=1 Tax=Aspergillus niger TaxID=5061 RepID=A0A117E295_ASPNG|nr:glycine-rich domain-containing protein 1 [Aspergillus tubingensis]GAQ43296.1 hypothetical protein AKAW_03172 [Aspergillus niger]GFN19926.1 glycine-rich domain-containing protein 1 [Aspergillus tubingensis]